MPLPPTAPEEAAEETTPTLLEEILEQIFLRLPPDEPECLVRASLTSKLWHALLSGGSFRRRFRDYHGAPPMLGFLTATAWDSDELEEGGPAAQRFVSTTKGFRERDPPGEGWGHGDYNACDCRHGRVLLRENNARRLVVWDPMTGHRWELQEPDEVYGYGLYAAAVLCAVSGCDHLSCHDGPFRIVHFSLHGIAGDDFVAQAYVSSMDFRYFVEWSDPCPGVSVGGDGYIEPRPPVLLNGALHFLLAHGSSHGVRYTEILKYDLSSSSLSVIDAPKAGLDMPTVSVLMEMHDGNLGFAHLKKLTLFIWSRNISSSDGVAAWTRCRVLKLKNHLPVQNPSPKDVSLVGSVEGRDVVLVTTDLGIYKIYIKTLQHNKISDGEYLVSLIPYMSFNHQQEKGETL